MILIAAMTENRIIGKDNALPWHISKESKHFRRLTTGGTMIMGRRTYDSIGKPLPNRRNIVVSRTMSPTYGVDVCDSLENAVLLAESFGGEIFCMGGAELYRQTLNIADKLYISYVKGSFSGDTYFPEFEDGWEKEKEEEHEEFRFVVYHRKKPVEREAGSGERKQKP